MRPVTHRRLLYTCLLVLGVSGCIDRPPSLDDDLDATLPDAALLDGSAPDLPTPDAFAPDVSFADFAVADAGLDDALFPDAAEAEPEPSPDAPERVRPIGFSADGRYLFIARLDAQLGDDQVRLDTGQLERHTIATGAQVVIDTGVILAFPNQAGVLFDARGETVVYARRADDLPDDQWWLDRVAPTFHQWSPDRRRVHGRATRVMLDVGGQHLLTWPWEADFVEITPLDDGPALRLRPPSRFHAWGNQVVLADDAEVTVLDLATAQRRTLARDAALIGVEGAYALLNEDEQLVVHDLASGDRIATPVPAPRAVAFFGLDRALGRAVLGIGQGAYGAVRTWSLDGDVVEDVEMPAAREAGGAALAAQARLHADGLVYYPHATWVGRDMWDLRDGVATLIQRNNCTDRPLPGRAARLVVGSALGCSTAGPRQMSLYDEASLTLSPTGLESRGISALLADGRVLFNDGANRAGMVWDIDADTVDPLGGQLGRSQTRRDGAWMVGLLRTDDAGWRTLVVAHPDGVTQHPQADAIAEMIATDTHVAWVVRAEDGDTLHVRTLDALR